jgi:SpoVK/Ycf46/Vps4 family AAA+-type ATPase
MTKDISNNKTIKNILPKNSGIKKPPLLLCNNPYNNIHKKLFRNNTYNHIYNMNRLRLSLDNYKYSSNSIPKRRKPIRRDLFKKWVRDIDMDYQKKFGKDNFYIDDENQTEVYLDKPNLPPIIEKKKISIQVEINNLNDLIELTEKYPIKYDVEYNINMQAIHNIKEPIKKLDNMIGMKKLKESILDQIIYFIQDLHINSEGDFMHTVIAGPPGTGKTEIAKIMGEIFCNLGILKKKKFKKVTRSDLIAGYLGQTALKTTEVIKDSLGGVLFIDEAYALGNEQKKDSFAKECIDTLCEALSNHKDNLMVIVAGYEKDLNKCFFSYNKGLDSRFTWRFSTDNYNASELNQIFKKKIADISWKSYKIKDNWFEKNMNYFSFFGRDMETLLAKVKIAHSRRVFCLSNDKKKQITLDDLNKGFDIFLNNDEVKNRNTTSIINHMYC